MGKNNKKLTIIEFIERSNIIHDNKYDYSKGIYKNNYTKIIIICPIHGEFLQKPGDHLCGSGCSKCNGGVISNTKEFIEKSIKIYGDVYKYSKVNYIHGKTHVIIICSKHGEFNQRPCDHLQGHGCIYCFNGGDGFSSLNKYDKLFKHKLIHSKIKKSTN